MATDGLSVTAQMDGNVKAGGVYQTDSSDPHESGLASGVFPNHPKTGPWYTLAGEAMTPWEITPLESVAEGDSRHQTGSTAQETDAVRDMAEGSDSA